MNVLRHDPERLPVGPVPAASVLPVRLPRFHAAWERSGRTSFVANDNVTALNYEVGIKGQPFDNLQMSIAVFYTDYSDLPYQVEHGGAGGRLQHRATSSWTRPRWAWSGKASGRRPTDSVLHSTLGLRYER